MNWLYLALLSNFIFAIVFGLDKILVKRAFSPLAYALVVGGLEGMAVILIPFVDFILPQKLIIAAAILSGLFFISGLYFYFKALVKYEASWVAPLLFGVFVPIITFIFEKIFLGENFLFTHIIALFLFVIGGIILSFSRGHKFSVVLLLFFAAVFISLDFILLKIVFINTNFWSGYILSRLGGFFAAGIILLLFLRKNPSHKFDVIPIKKFNFEITGVLLALKEVLAFVGNLILLFTLSLASPTLINGLGGVRYAFLFVFAVILAGKWPRLMDEKMSFWLVIRKIIAIIFIIFGVLILLIQPAKTPGAKIWGVDFSSLYTRQLGLDSREVLPAILNDLKVKDFRLNAHWSEIEKAEGHYDFSELDFQVNEIEKAGGKIILSVGKRLPRWPECHEPEWIKKEKEEMKNEKLLKYIEKVVNRYKNNESIWAWQVENEPFLWGFGECPRTDDEFLEKEILLVKSLDPPPGRRQIIITDSGELGLWHRAYRRADIFGTTMYRVVYLELFDRYVKYPISPEYFKIKAVIMENLFGKKQIINSELQAEPWLRKRPPDVPLEEQLKVFDINQFKENMEYARSVGFEKNYLWGVEWIYWMKEKQNHPEFWEEARKLF
ncbi:hypothetical protein A2999_02465 [Candidatus Wolfebacteria bacterium RIFCSPLOWO2_01_FULL_38_11]|uniref:Uncharacterized protein n=2 Tax=Candidatus Wolfeibacteriota TaxID=1752735 RepID=A0A0G0IC85_9BACT|nr:MAG: hypothetical protein US36_C0012G0013 [Candidatus Wolfebacteria bacterium GW2011_GWC1_37_10]OGM90534.1 MAG: hypothetical protein A2999_02465 [Candidatus Wolfebacteria bacterium RIFCSPLOWO2_01_FULL_38_11]